MFSAYPKEVRSARHAHIITGLPDAYGRGRIIGDYRRIALYGTENLIAERKRFMDRLDIQEMTEECIRMREETAEQIQALKDFGKMCQAYGFDVTRPAQDAREAVQFVYFGYLGAVKDQDGAAMSLGRVSTFLDIFIEKDIKEGRLTEKEAQELIDQMVMKLRIVRFLRTPEYNDLFSGDPVWVTEHDTVFVDVFDTIFLPSDVHDTVVVDVHSVAYFNITVTSDDPTRGYVAGNGRSFQEDLSRR